MADASRVPQIGDIVWFGATVDGPTGPQAAPEAALIAHIIPSESPPIANLTVFRHDGATMAMERVPLAPPLTSDCWSWPGAPAAPARLGPPA